MLIEELIFERSRASLYHFTAYDIAYEILNMNTLLVNIDTGTGDIPNTISFTRSPKYNIKSGEPAIRFEVDQDKLKTKHKIRPYVWLDLQNSILAGNYNRAQDNEFEEVVFGDITNFDDYLVEFSIPDHDVYSRNFKHFYNKIIEYQPKQDQFDFYLFDRYFEKDLIIIKFFIEHPKLSSYDRNILKDLYNRYNEKFKQIK